MILYSISFYKGVFFSYQFLVDFSRVFLLLGEFFVLLFPFLSSPEGLNEHIQTHKLIQVFSPKLIIFPISGNLREINLKMRKS